MTARQNIAHCVPDVPAEAFEAVAEVLRQRQLSAGVEVSRLEALLAEAHGGAEVVAVASGTAALYLALKALGVGPGQQVAMPSYTCNSLYAAVAHAGAAPLCADCGPGQLVLTPETLAAVLTPAVSAAIVPHTFGFPADIAAMRRHGLPVIEDCAHAAGGRAPDGRLLGTLGDIGVLSFFATKLLPAGEGGACITSDAALAATLRRLRNCDEQALDPRAFNFKLNDLCATLARVQWQHLQAQLSLREQQAVRYDGCLAPWSLRAHCPVPQRACFRYLVLAEDAAAFIAAAGAAGVTCRRPVFRPLHLTLGGPCPRAEALQRRLVSLPFRPALSAAEERRVCDTTRGLLLAPAPAGPVFRDQAQGELP